MGYIQGFYLPWAFLGLDLIFGDPLKPDILGMVAGHLYYFLTVLHPLAGGKLMLKTPLWVYPFMDQQYLISLVMNDSVDINKYICIIVDLNDE